MEFDVIIGNPPYFFPKIRTSEAINGAGGKKIWDKFFELSVKLVKENGYICLIHPGTYRKPENELLKTMQNMNLIYLEIHNMNDGLKLFKVWTGYDWYILQNCKYNGKTTIKDKNGKIQCTDISKMGFIPNCSFDLINSIIAKEGEEKLNIIYSRREHGHDKKWMSEKKTDIHIHPCIYGITKKNGIKEWYSKEKSNQFIPKIVITMTKFLNPYVDVNGTYGRRRQ